MSLVLDASVALAWVHPDEASAHLDSLLDRVRAEGALTPPIWLYEVSNVLTLSMRRGRIGPADRASILTELRALGVRISDSPTEETWAATLRLADEYRLTVYDAAYLELAMRRGLPLATLDERRGEAARAAGVAVLP